MDTTSTGAEGPHNADLATADHATLSGTDPGNGAIGAGATTEHARALRDRGGAHRARRTRTTLTSSCEVLIVEPDTGPMDMGRVLLVDDDRALRDAVSRALRLGGYEGVLALDGSGALRGM